MKKIYLIIGVVIICLTGCSKTNYIRDTSKGEIQDISFETLADKIENDKSFLLQISLKNCEYCKYVKNIETEYIKKHNITIYNYTLDNSDENFKAEFDYIKKHFKNFEIAPSLYWVDNKKNKNLLTFEIDEEERQLDKFIIKYEIDKK